MPETKPDLHLDDEGVCSACRYMEQRHEIDWDARREELATVLDRYRSKDGSNYDCIIPVSGGKGEFRGTTVTLIEELGSESPTQLKACKRYQ